MNRSYDNKRKKGDQKKRLIRCEERRHSRELARIGKVPGCHEKEVETRQMVDFPLELMNEAAGAGTLQRAAL